MNPKNYVSHYITEKRVLKYIAEGKCPVHFVFLTSHYHPDDCRYVKDRDAEAKIVDKENTCVIE